MRQVWPGGPFPLGATWDGEGTSFSLFSEHAERVELCLFDEQGAEERVPLVERTAYNWHGYLPGVGPGQRYAYRVHGRYDPGQGHRFNPQKLLIDPYAKAIEGAVDWAAGNVLPYVPNGTEDADLEPDDEDDASAIPKCVVVDPSFDWEDDAPPDTPWTATVIYEVHVKGLTQRFGPLREELRGTFAGLASDEAIEHFRSLGVTAVELLPVHHIADESFLVGRGLTNYWGYSSIGFLAPHALYSASGTGGEQVREFKGMVKALHRAGIEVILDVVYNHTAEGNHLGPMLSFKGVDNASYYRLSPDDPRHYVDFTGTGNSLNPVHPSVLRLIMDSLRYWAMECHVDGFRFDLAAALAREFYDVNRLSAFFDIIHQDPVLSQAKLIAEPWDVGPGGYQVGNFPVLWTEWNGLYRDTVRDFWRGATNGVGDFAARLSGLERPLCGATDAARSRRSTSSPPTTASRSPTSSRTTRSTTRRTSRTTGTAPTTTAPGTAASRGRPTIPRCSSCAGGSSATSWPRSCSRRACRCCSAATSSRARSTATTTPGARTTSSRGSTGSSTTSGASCSSSRGG